MKYSVLVLALLIISVSLFAAEKQNSSIKLDSMIAGGSVGGSAGGTDEEKVKVPTGLIETDDEIQLGKTCLTSIDPQYNFSNKLMTTEFLKSEIIKSLSYIKKNKGRSIASISNDQDTKSFDCYIFAKIHNDPNLTNILVPTNQVESSPAESLPVKAISK